MNFNSEESREQLRELIGRLAEKMHAKGDPWLLKDSTAREDSWYNRHLGKEKKEKEKKESVVKKEKKECVRVMGDHDGDDGRVSDEHDKGERENDKNDKDNDNKCDTNNVNPTPKE